MKKTLLITTICSIMILGALSVNAAGINIENPLKYGTIPEVIDAIANFIAILSSSIAMIMIIWAGIVYMTAGDSEERTKGAKKTIQWALIGIAIVWCAKFLIDIIEWILGKT